MSLTPPWWDRPPLAASITRSPREIALSEWRHISLAPVEKELASSARSTFELMPKVLKTLGIDRRQSEAEIARVWNNLIDPVVAAHAQPSGIAKGTLFVTVDSHVWLDEIIRFRRREILQRLQHSFGKEVVKKISFRVG